MRVGHCAIGNRHVAAHGAGRHYVVFGEVFSGNGVVFPSHVPIFVDGRRLSSSWPFKLATGLATDPLKAIPFKLVAEVRRLMR
jgi:hypothetical protein